MEIKLRLYSIIFLFSFERFGFPWILSVPLPFLLLLLKRYGHTHFSGQRVD
jgi:hypothetical protein